MSEYEKANALLCKMLGPSAQFREGQWEAIEMIALKHQRALIVQRTGWGKSLVYFLATRLLREQGAGPTFLISPLLALMRNQIAMAKKIGIRAVTINSSNSDEWPEVEDALANNQCDLLLVSPERLNNLHFTRNLMPRIAGQIGLFVVDEAHCISDWGHDFRPDYRRITRIIKMLPKGVPVLGTTATANNRVVEDIRSQLGLDLLILRGPLKRESLRLQNIRLDTQADRLAWLAENLPKFDGSGIIYCLTVADAERVAAWLRQKGFKAESYHAGSDQKIDRSTLEQDFLENKIKILVATVALGMGFDKADVQFVIHFQRPGSVIAYYQQVGRAGRGLDRSYGILLNGTEDDEIQQYFIDTAFPSYELLYEIIDLLENNEKLTLYQFLSRVNANRTMLEKALRLLELDEAIGRSTQGKQTSFFRTPNPWNPDVERIENVMALRQAEVAQMQEYVSYTGCLMEFLLKALDAPDVKPCGKCANCQNKGFSNSVSSALVTEAETFLKGGTITIKPRARWPHGLFDGVPTTIAEELRNEEGRSLCYYGDSGWGKLVKDGKYRDAFFSDELVEASARLVLTTWKLAPMPTWVTAIPSQRHPVLVPEFAKRLAEKLGLPYHPVLERVKAAPEQKTMQNSMMQASNVINTIEIKQPIPVGPVLLVDDILDSGWTLTMAGYLLRKKGSGPVYPFTLAQAAGRNNE